jgi:hypothetical protein
LLATVDALFIVVLLNKKPDFGRVPETQLRVAEGGLSAMTDKTFVIRFKQPGPSTQLVIAARAETHGDLLVLLDTKGKPIARFPADAIESWTEGPI